MSGCWSLIRDLHLVNYEAYGSRKTWLALRRAGHEAGRDRVERIFAERGSAAPRAAVADTQPDLTRRLPDLVERRFEAVARTSSGSRTSPGAVAIPCAARR